MSSFVSTRGSDEVTLPEALFTPLARDGGLFVPAELGHWSELPPGDAHGTIMRWAAPELFPEVDPEVLERVVADALSFPMPLVEVEPGILVLELFHGPTAAFKDVGARFLARLAGALARDDRPRTVLVATSGDTGGAVAAAFHRVSGFRVVVLFPGEGVSDLQRRQMTTLGDNVAAIAVEGTFDDCQSLAKRAFGDEGMCRRFALMSANSINIGRLLPQTLYYLTAAAQVGWKDSPARFYVPSGNLGNLCAGLLAHAMGMPAAGFVAAANANRGFADFLSGASFRPRPVVPTDSSAMDVGDPSNLERLLWLYGGDADALRADVAGVVVSDVEARARIETVHRRTGYLLDPHTAVAYEAGVRHPGEDGAPRIVLATAHPAKFAEVVEPITGEPVPLPPALARARSGVERMHHIEPSLAALAELLSREDL